MRPTSFLQWVPNRQELSLVISYWKRRRRSISAAVGFTLLATALEMSIPSASKALVDATLLGRVNTNSVWKAWLVFIAIYSAFALSRNTALRIWIPLSALTMREITVETFDRVQRFTSTWHAENQSGFVVRNISMGTWGFDAVAGAIILSILPAILVMLGLSIQLSLKWPLIGVFSLVISALFTGTNLFFSTFYVRPATSSAAALDAQVGGALTDSIAANAVVKSFAAEERESARVAEAADKWFGQIKIAWMRHVNVWLSHDILLAILQAGLTGLVVERWTHGGATPGDIAYAVASFLIMSSYLSNVGSSVRAAQKGLSDITGISNYARASSEFDDRHATDEFRPLRGEIQFEHVNFKYPGAEEPALDNFSLRVAAGERIALVGPSGSGKSTFVKLLQRLYEVDSGRIIIDGQDISQVSLRSLRSSIAVVSQDPTLFNRSLRENIAYARPTAKFQEVVEVAKAAQAHDFVLASKGGYEMMVGERGVKLSGGERQRLTIARALLAKSQILILDEASSSLDVRTEVQVQSGINKRFGSRTVIIITHRLSTLVNADRIVVFESGRVVEDGSHEQLMTASGPYARMRAARDQGNDAPNEMNLNGTEKS